MHRYEPAATISTGSVLRVQAYSSCSCTYTQHESSVRDKLPSVGRDVCTVHWGQSTAPAWAAVSFEDCSALESE